MAAMRCNYLVIYDNSPQVYSSASLETILKTEHPKNCEDANRSVLFISYFPDEEQLRIFEVTDEELEAERVKVEERDLRVAEKRAKKAESDVETS